MILIEILSVKSVAFWFSRKILKDTPLFFLLCILNAILADPCPLLSSIPQTHSLTHSVTHCAACVAANMLAWQCRLLESLKNALTCATAAACPLSPCGITTTTRLERNVQGWATA